MNKISNSQAAAVMHDAAATIRKQQEKIAFLSTQLDSRNKRDRIEKIATAIQSKNLDPEQNFQEIVHGLEKAAASNKLDAIEMAVGFVGPDMGSKIAQLGTSEDSEAPKGASAFERFITGSVG